MLKAGKNVGKIGGGNEVTKVEWDFDGMWTEAKEEEKKVERNWLYAGQIDPNKTDKTKI